MIGLVVTLVPLNWWLESTKWRMLVRPIQTIGRGRAFRATLAGTAIALITPNRTGEFIGRVLYLDPSGRVAGSIATILGSIAQFVITLVVGSLGLVMMMVFELPLIWTEGGRTIALLALAVAIAALALLGYFFPGSMRRVIQRIPVFQRWDHALRVLDRTGRRSLSIVLLLSLLRYGVFSGQFVLLCMAFGSGVPVHILVMTVPVIYLITTLIPTMLVSEIGVRGSIALTLLLPIGAEPIAIMAATGTLWLLNLVIPAVVGSVLLLTTHIRTAT